MLGYAGGAGHCVLWVLWYRLDRYNEFLKPFISVEQTCMTTSNFYFPFPLFEENRGSLCHAVDLQSHRCA